MSRTYRRDFYNLRKGKTCRDGTVTLACTPGWWVNQYMNRPKRRLNQALCHQVRRGEDADELAWPTGNRKPHCDYW